MHPNAADELDDDYRPDGTFEASESEEELSLPGEDELAYDGATTSQDASAKKRKRREKDKLRKAKRVKVQSSSESTVPNWGSQHPAVLAKILANAQAKAYTDMSVLELQDIAISESWIADTTSFTDDRTLDRLCDFISLTLPTLKVRLAQKSKANGAPTLIFVAGAALRVADVARELRKMRGDKGGDVAKLFAKHFKLEEHISYLRRTKIGAAVGTPGRLGKLLAESAISLTALTHIILDASHEDVKKRSILDIPETRDELFKTVLGDTAIREALQSGRVKLVLF